MKEDLITVADDEASTEDIPRNDGMIPVKDPSGNILSELGYDQLPLDDWELTGAKGSISACLSAAAVASVLSSPRMSWRPC